MKDFNIELSYSIISAIRAGISSQVSEEEKIGYDIDTAELVFNETKGYDLQEIIKFIESKIEHFNSPFKLKKYRKPLRLRILCPSRKLSTHYLIHRIRNRR